MKRYLLDGIVSEQMRNAKLVELYILLIHYYTPEECIDLFYPVLEHKLEFRLFVLNNYCPTISINDLAEKAGMSRSTFDRNFKEAFNTTPYKWIDLQMRLLIMRRLAEPNVTIKDIMYEIGVNSPSHFTQLCKRLLGVSPSELIRNKSN